jgi:acetolactate synthase I/II/III large subunit
MKIKLADYLINYIAELGVEKAFIVYGAANGDIVDAFTRTKKIEYVAVMHEQAGGFAAEGYAKVKGKKIPGVAIATSGPGGMNFVTAIGNCYYDSVPTIFLTGQIKSQFLKPDPSIRQVGFQETDIVSIVKPITKYAKMIKDPNSIKYELDLAVHLATTGRQGPVLLDLPIDLQKAIVDTEKLYGYDSSVNAEEINLSSTNDKVEKFLDDFEKSSRPVLMIGGGVRSAEAIDDLHELGHILKCPMYPTWNALDIVTSDYDYYAGRIGTYGGAGRNFGIQNSDLLLAIGSRISGRVTGGNISTFARKAKKYVVDIDQTLLQKQLQQVPFDENIYCDAKVFIEKLKIAAKKRSNLNGSNHESWLNQCIKWKNDYDPVQKEFYNNKENIQPYYFIRELSKKMTKSDVFVVDCGGNVVICNHSFETKKGQRYFSNNGNSPMGFSFSGALGAYFADQSRQVVCVIGDGGMNMNIQELQTIKNYNIKVKTIILNNHIYGITKAYQKTNFSGRMEACGPVGYNPPDFIKIAQAYGIETMNINNHEEAPKKMDEFLKADCPMVIDVNCHEYHTYEPRIFGWKTPIEDMFPYLPRDEFKKNMIIDPVEGWEECIMPEESNPKNNME